MLREEQIERYARHILLREVGGVGQERILTAAVRLRGLGRIGCWAASYLALAGVGSLALDDERPIPAGGLLPLLPASRAGQRRDLAVAEEIPSFNPDVEVHAVTPGGDWPQGWGELGAPGAEAVWAASGDDRAGFLAIAAGDEAILGWSDRICASCLWGALADPLARPDDAITALTGSLVASALLAAILDPPQSGPNARRGLHRRGIAGGQEALPPCPHQAAGG